MAGALEVVQQSPGMCGFQLGRSKAFPLLEILAVWRYVKWWIPGLPVRRLQERGKKKKSKILDYFFFYFVSFKISTSEGLWEDLSSRVIY